MTNDLNSSGRLRAEVHGLRLRLLFLSCFSLIVDYAFICLTWFDVFMQLPYPILRIFGEKDRVRWVTEVPEDVAEPFLHGFPEVRKLRYTFWFYPSLGLVLKLLFLRRL
jgi:hypothetical protein